MRLFISTSVKWRNLSCNNSKSASFVNFTLTFNPVERKVEQIYAFLSHAIKTGFELIKSQCFSPTTYLFVDL